MSLDSYECTCRVSARVSRGKCRRAFANSDTVEVSCEWRCYVSADSVSMHSIIWYHIYGIYVGCRVVSYRLI